jgi:hypothetical protein
MPMICEIALWLVVATVIVAIVRGVWIKVMAELDCIRAHLKGD